MQITVGINRLDGIPDNFGQYLESFGLINAAQNLELDYSYCDKNKTYDVVINWEPFDEFYNGKYLTIVWVSDTHISTINNKTIGKKYDLLFRRHMTFYHPQGIQPVSVDNDGNVIARKIYIIPQYVDEEVFDRFNDNPDYDIAWVGLQREQQWQGAVFQEFEKNFKVLKIYDRLNYEDYVKALNRGKLVLNIPRDAELNKKFTESMAIGPALMPWGPDYTLIAIPDYHYVQFEMKHDITGELVDFDASIDKIKRLLNNPNKLKKIRQQGRKLIEQHLTFKHQAERVHRIISTYFLEHDLYRKKEEDEAIERDRIEKEGGIKI